MGKITYLWFPKKKQAKLSQAKEYLDFDKPAKKNLPKSFLKFNKHRRKK